MTEPAPRSLVAGDLAAVFLPDRGMLGASLKRRGVELLRRVGDLEAAGAKGSTAGIPLLHPWANRLSRLDYCVAGREVKLDPASPLLHLDANGLPSHGVPWSRLAWEVTEAADDRLAARLAWEGADLLGVFPFPHRLEMAVALGPAGLTIETTLVAGPGGAVPVAFGFHPYVGIPGCSRDAWRIELPSMRRLPTDSRGIPTGEETASPGMNAPLGHRTFDDGFALESDTARFAVSGPDARISVELLRGYSHAQVYAPAGEDFIAFEPMTAPVSALTSGRGLRLVEPGGRFTAAFRIGVGVPT